MKKRNQNKNVGILLTLFGAFFLLPLLAMAATTITNSVSVSAESSDARESSVQVKTVVNGQIVEDWSATSSDTITYTSSHHTDGENTTTTTTVSAQNTQSDIAILQTLLAHLQVLIKLYGILNSL